MAPPAPPSRPWWDAHRLSVRRVGVEHGQLHWTTTAGDGDGDGRVALDDVVFTLDRSGQPRDAPAFVVCCLERRHDAPAPPFRLLLLAADAVPAELLRGPPRLDGLPAHLNCVDVVVSVKSGLGLAAPFWEAVLRPLLDAVADAFGSDSPPPVAVVTEHALSVRRFARSLPSGRRPTTVVLLSGDGGVADLLNGLDAAPASPPPLLALLPLGTGNALFHSLHRPVASDPGPDALVLGLRTLFLGAPAPLPVFRAVFSAGARVVTHTEAVGTTVATRHDAPVSTLHGAIVASYGFHASVVYESDTPEYRAHGDKRFAMVAHELLRQSHPYRARVSTRGPSSPRLEQDPHQTHAYVLVSLVSNLERTFAISPASKPLDGRLRLLHFGAVGGERTRDVMTKAYDGGAHVGIEWDDGEALRYEEVDEVVVEALDDDARWRKFCVDGTIVEVPQGGSMAVSKASESPIRILVDSQCRGGA